MTGLGAGNRGARIAFQMKDGDRWSNQFQLWGAIRFLRGSEVVLQGRVAGKNTAVISFRDGRKVRTATTHWRLKLVETGDVFAIKSIINDQNEKRLDFTCEAGTPT